jgi:hypothetical protein
MKPPLTRIPRSGAVALALLPALAALTASSLGVAPQSPAAWVAWLVFTAACCGVGGIATARSSNLSAGLLSMSLLVLNGCLMFGYGCSACNGNAGH